MYIYQTRNILICRYMIYIYNYIYVEICRNCDSHTSYIIPIDFVLISEPYMFHACSKLDQKDSESVDK